MQTPDTRPINGLSVDVEDWIQSVLDPSLPLTNHFCDNTRRLLELFASQGVQATFFVLGLAAEKAPELVREIHQAGHEIQSHGYGHRRLHTLTAVQLRQDLTRSKELLEDITGQPVTGYRAPAFSIDMDNLWALDVLVESGYEYDSSVFPVRTRRYGVAGAPRIPHRLRTPAGYEIVEVPVASYRLLGRTIPIGGGGYFRLFPYWMIRGCVRQFNEQSEPATIYCHPYECNRAELGQLPQPIPWRLRLHQSIGRRRFLAKMRRLLSEFRFGCVRDVLASIGELPRVEYTTSATGMRTPRIAQA